MEGKSSFLRDRVGLTAYARVYSYDMDTSLIVLCDPNASRRKGVWVDVTLCLNPKYSGPWRREPMHMVTVVGYLEACEVRLVPSDRSVVTGTGPAPATRT
jgi:hypothetical protein